MQFATDICMASVGLDVQRISISYTVGLGNLLAAGMFVACLCFIEATRVQAVYYTTTMIISWTHRTIAFSLL